MCIMSFTMKPLDSLVRSLSNMKFGQPQPLDSPQQLVSVLNHISVPGTCYLVRLDNWTTIATLESSGLALVFQHIYTRTL